MATFSLADGRDLALQMLREMEAYAGRGNYPLCAEYRELGDLQSNIALRYLQALQERGDSQLTEGFASVLTDFLGTVFEGGTPNLDCAYEGITDADLGPGTLADED